MEEQWQGASCSADVFKCFLVYCSISTVTVIHHWASFHSWLTTAEFFFFPLLNVSICCQFCPPACHTVIGGYPTDFEVPIVVRHFDFAKSKVLRFVCQDHLIESKSCDGLLTRLLPFPQQLINELSYLAGSVGKQWPLCFGPSWLPTFKIFGLIPAHTSVFDSILSAQNR